MPVRPLVLLSTSSGVFAITFILFFAPLANAPTLSPEELSTLNEVVATAEPTLPPAPAPEEPSPGRAQAVSPASASSAASGMESPQIPVSENAIYRIEEPYSTPPLSFEMVNVQARAALVNILCTPDGGSLNPITGSGVLIHPRGVILTNAHVAQYVLLSQSPQVGIRCTIRAGSPASPAWSTRVLYLPPIWIEKHAADIKTARPLGTGEHDYALLYVTGSVNGLPLPPTFPHLVPDTREAVGFVGDTVLAASYPAEFLGALASQNNLYPATSVTTVEQLLTFNVNTADVLSIGGVIGAQSGSSGGAVANAWARLIGLITTTSEGDTTADRDLRAISLSHVHTDLKAQSGLTLAEWLAGDYPALAQDFNTHVAPALIQALIAELTH